MTDLESHAQDTDVRRALEELAFIDECVEARHQYTDWGRNVALWIVQVKLDNAVDVGALVTKIDIELDHAEPEGIEPEGQVSVYPDGRVELSLNTGPGVDDDE